MAARNVMVLAELRAAQPGEIAFRLIGASAIRAHELDTVIDPAHVVSRDQPIPSAAFVGMDHGAGSDPLTDHRNRLALARDNPRDHAPAALASDGDNLAPGYQYPPVGPIFLAALRPDVAA